LADAVRAIQTLLNLSPEEVFGASDGVKSRDDKETPWSNPGMHDLQGEFAEWHNFRRKRSNAFWGGRYHATMIESGTHLWNCMTYIDLNMVKAGEVKHPHEWKWGGYDELVGARRRYTVLRMDKLLELVGSGSREEFARDYAAASRTGRSPSP
jgi:putative transposase